MEAPRRRKEPGGKILNDAPNEIRKRTMTAAPIQDVSETALMVAVWRAQENERRDPLYRDPFALNYKLAGTRGQEIVAGRPRIRATMGAWMMAVRTRIVDDLIGEVLARCRHGPQLGGWARRAALSHESTRKPPLDRGGFRKAP